MGEPLEASDASIVRWHKELGSDSHLALNLTRLASSSALRKTFMTFSNRMSTLSLTSVASRAAIWKSSVAGIPKWVTKWDIVQTDDGSQLARPHD